MDDRFQQMIELVFPDLIIDCAAGLLAKTDARLSEAKALLGDLRMVECSVRTEPCEDCDPREARDFMGGGR